MPGFPIDGHIFTLRYLHHGIFYEVTIFMVLFQYVLGGCDYPNSYSNLPSLPVLPFFLQLHSQVQPRP